MNYQSFIFESYAYDTTTSTATFTYSFDGTLLFTEAYVFKLPDELRVSYDTAALDRAVQLLFFIVCVKSNILSVTEFIP